MCHNGTPCGHRWTVWPVVSSSECPHVLDEPVENELYKSGGQCPQGFVSLKQ